MQPSNDKWLHISVFYQMEDWNTLLSNCIRPFLVEGEKKYLLNYLLHLNDERGENIRFSFLVESSFCKEFLIEIEQLLNKYCHNHPSVKPYTKLPINGFLLDFPVNTVFFKLHQSSFFMLPDQASQLIYKLQYSLSNTIIEAFKFEKFDKDGIFSFYAYIAFAFLAMYDNKFDDLEKLAASYLNDLSKQWDEKELLDAQNLSIEYKQDLLEIAADSFSEKGSVLDLHWLPAWRQACRNFIEKFEIVIHCTESRQTIILSLEKIAEQLNLQNKKAKTINWLLFDATKTFKSNNNTHLTCRT